MSEPIRMQVDLGSVPTAEAIAKLACKGQHVVLKFSGASPDSAMNEVGEKLASALPDHSVFCSGVSQLTVLPVIAASEVLALADDLVAAARDFRITARALCLSLAQKLELQPDALLDVDEDRTSGELDADWTYYVHGSGCCFEHQITGQRLDVVLSFGAEFGVLDPFFFHCFLATTKRYRPLAAALTEDFHDTRRALSVLAAAGRLTTISVADGARTRAGLVAPLE